MVGRERHIELNGGLLGKEGGTHGREVARQKGGKKGYLIRRET